MWSWWIFPLEMDVCKSLLAAGESKATHSWASSVGSTSKRLCLNWATSPATQLTLPCALWEPLSLYVESVVSSVADPRGHPTSTFLFETWSAGLISTSPEPLSSALTSAPHHQIKELYCLLHPEFKGGRGFVVVEICFQILKSYVTLFFLLQKQYMFVINIVKQCREAERRN